MGTAYPTIASNVLCSLACHELIHHHYSFTFSLFFSFSFAGGNYRGCCHMHRVRATQAFYFQLVDQPHWYVVNKHHHHNQITVNDDDLHVGYKRSKTYISFNEGMAGAVHINVPYSCALVHVVLCASGSFTRLHPYLAVCLPIRREISSV